MQTTKESFVPALSFGWLTAYYDALAHSFLPEKKFKTVLIRQANIRPGDKVLDFGSGTATLTLLAWQHQPGAEYVGLDVDPAICKIARKKISAMVTPQPPEGGVMKSPSGNLVVNRKIIALSSGSIRIDIYNGSDLPYPDNHFDRVISSLTFHHLSREQKKISLKEIYRVLKPGGELHIADWGKAQNKFMRLMFYFVQVFDGFSRTEDNVKGLLLHYLSETEFENVEETGWLSTIVGTLSLYAGVKKS